MHYKNLNSFKHFSKRKNSYFDIEKLLRRRKPYPINMYPKNMYATRLPEVSGTFTIQLTEEQQKLFQDSLTWGT